MSNSKSDTEKVAVYGGSFDPITKAHVRIIENLSKRFDKVIVVPCRVSPFKTKTSASAEERLEMLGMETNGLSNVEIYEGEIRSNEPNYTYLTLEKLSGTDKELYLVMGSEMVIELERWKRVDKLRELSLLYIISRPEYEINDELKNKLDELFKDKWTIADFDGEVGSSSEVRITFAMGKPEMYMTERTAAYAKEHGLYDDYGFINKLYADYKLKPKRIEHSYSTALCGVRMAKRVKVNTDKATLALLLHDIGKSTSLEDAESMGLKLREEVKNMPEPIRHAEIGAEIIRQKLNISDEEIVEAVRWHTTGKPAMTELEKVVFLADCIEPLRDYPTVDEIRKATEISVDNGVKTALKRTVEYIGEDNIYPMTLKAYEYYKEK